MDIRDYPEVIELINAILQNNGIVEIKKEGRDDHIAVVEIRRTLKNKR